MSYYNYVVIISAPFVTFANNFVHFISLTLLDLIFRKKMLSFVFRIHESVDLYIFLIRAALIGFE